MKELESSMVTPNWEAVEREHLLAFRALPIWEKLRAVEESCELARHFQKRKAIREGETNRRES